MRFYFRFWRWCWLGLLLRLRLGLIAYFRLCLGLLFGLCGGLFGRKFRALREHERWHANKRHARQKDQKLGERVSL